MGLFGQWGEDLWNGWNDLTGDTATTNATNATKDLTKTATDRSTKYGGMFDKSFGADAGEFMKNSQNAASGLAADQAQFQSMEQAKNALKAARGAGMNRGQAALSAGQATSGAYGQTYNNALNSGMDRYGQATAMLGNQATGNQSAAFGGAGQQYGQANDKATGFWGGVGGLAGGAANLLGMAIASGAGGGAGGAAGGAGAAMASDERVKEDVTSSFGTLDDALKHLKAVRYKYKDNAPTQNAGKEEVGVMAQDLEKVPGMAGSVIDTPEGKKVDGAQLEGANTALIIELASQIKELQRQLGGKK